MTNPEKCAKCGQPLRQRSSEEHRHFFAVLRSVYENWPYSDKFKPESAEHLRRYLLIHAGHCNTVDFSTDGGDVEAFTATVISLMRAEGDKHPIVHHFGEYLRVYIPKSMAYRECKVEIFRAVKATVFEIIKNRTGINCDEVTGQEAA